MIDKMAYSNIYIFPAIFETDNEDNKINVTFPDLINCFSNGENIKDAMINATEALENVIYWMKKDKQIIPVSSSIKNITISEDQFILIIMADMRIANKRWE